VLMGIWTRSELSVAESPAWNRCVKFITNSEKMDSDSHSYFCVREVYVAVYTDDRFACENRASRRGAGQK
jgi:hypothetical protein